MKRLKIGFLAVIALVAMSFTITSHSNLFKKDAPISGCYRDVSAFEFLTCSPAQFNQVIDCSSGKTAVNKHLKSGISVATFESGTVLDCTGNEEVCCVKFKLIPVIGNTPPCTPAGTTFLRGTISSGQITENPLASNYIVVDQLECKVSDPR